jgi:hypothetical protein
MDKQKHYLLDSNVFIEAHRRYYAFDLCPGFWECLLSHNGQVQSIDLVRKELEDKTSENKDPLWAWITSNLPDTFFRSNADARVGQQYAKIIQWVSSSSQYSQQAKDDFARVADGWLIAQAKTDNFVLVTHETLDKNIKKRVKIPNICEEFGVEYIDTFDMLRELKECFVRDAKHRH